MDALLGVLPSYTQLGMAALLPGAQLGINPADGTTVVDGQSDSGTENRDKMLKAYANGRAKAIQAEDFLNLPTSKEGAELIKEHDLIVVYHNRIDRIGDKRDTEADTCQAVEHAFEELDAILRKISSLKGSQAVITASELGLSGSWEAVFPLGLDRYHRSGSGSRFVHGGTSLQEVVVPVIRLKRERKDESRVVEAELLRGCPPRSPWSS